MLISIIIVICIVSGSYYNLLDLNDMNVTIKQEANAINLYTQKGVKEFQTNNGKFYIPDNSMTDIKYMAYQSQLADMINSFKKNVQSYNETLIDKRIMKKSWYWNWLIFLPSNMKIIKMTDYEGMK
jgi:hypothetical protein